MPYHSSPWPRPRATRAYDLDTNATKGTVDSASSMREAELVAKVSAHLLSSNSLSHVLGRRTARERVLNVATATRGAAKVSEHPRLSKLTFYSLHQGGARRRAT